MFTTLIVSVELTLLLSVAALHIVHCPFNKVEESFNTQAVHDIINIFPNNLPAFIPANQSTIPSDAAIRSHLPWDHTQYSGVVPRTFLGALLVGLPMRFTKYFVLNGFMTDGVEVKDDHDFTAQFILQIGSRFALASFLVISMSVLLKAIQRRYGLTYRLCFLIITITQFHYMFYASRFLPNTFSAILANLVFASWISRQYSKSIIYIAICVVIFRFDTAIFFGWLLLDGVFIRRILSFKKVLSIGIPAGLVAMLITTCIDSFFWARFVWPELEGLHFNVWLNKSHEWGTQPFLFYIYSCIPRIMMTSMPLLLVAEHKFSRDYFLPVAAFLLIYSLLPHKELRFVLFVTPLLNLSASSGLMNVYYYLNLLFVRLESKVKQRKSIRPSSGSLPKRNVTITSKSLGQKRSRIASGVFALFVAGLVISNLIACFVLSRISSHNYPGGQAGISLGLTKELLETAKQSMDNTVGLRDLRSDVAVYVDNLAAQTGISRFLQVDGVFYAKTLVLDDKTFLKPYKLIYLLLEPREVTSFLKSYCPIERNQYKFKENNLESWRKTNDEIKCQVPNQPEMYCSLIDTIESFTSINFGGLIRKFRQISSLSSVANIFGDEGFIKTRVALHILRCSTRSKFNPFA